MFMARSRPAYVLGPDGTRWHSWRTLLLPFIDQDELYEKYRFDEPWNGPHNWPLVDTEILRSFQCPSGSDYDVTPFTNYVVVVGEGTAFSGPEAVSLDEFNDPETAILFVEALNLSIHWADARDLELDSMSSGSTPQRHRASAVRMSVERTSPMPRPL